MIINAKESGMLKYLLKERKLMKQSGKEGRERRETGRHSREREQCVQRCGSTEDRVQIEEKTLRITNIAPVEKEYISTLRKRTKSQNTFENLDFIL